MKIFFILFLLLFTFSIHAIEQDNITLPDNPPTALKEDDVLLTSDTDQETDSSLEKKESRYVVTSNQTCSPLMMLGRPTSEKDPAGKKISPTNLLEQQQRITASTDPSAQMNRSSNPATLSENRNNFLSKSTLPQQQASALFKTLIYCPGCKQWHTGLSVSKKPLPQILFMWNPQTSSWHPLYRKDQQSSSSLLQRAVSSLTGEPFLEKAVESRVFQLLASPHNKDEEILYHAHSITGALEKSTFYDPINALPALSYLSRTLLQTHSRLPDSVIHFFLVLSEQKQRRPKALPPVGETEKSPLLPKNLVPINYSSISEN
ncbi:MAG: hypothetical protein FJ390_04275 [Verrucomicrobia bacterium]|nr:hypothetical protein [Verrucomicrobiota bacterium]